MTYKETGNLANLKAGDTLVMNDGTTHIAVQDNGPFQCDNGCSLWKAENPLGRRCRATDCICGVYSFHFKQTKP